MKYAGIFTSCNVCFCLLFVVGCGGSPTVERIGERRLRFMEQAKDAYEPIRGGIGRTTAPSEKGEAQPAPETEGVVTRWFRTRVTGRAASSPSRFVSGRSARKSSSLSATRSRVTRSDDFPLEDEVARDARKPARAINIEGLRSPVSGADEDESELTREDLADELLGEELREEEAPDDMEVYEEDDDDLESILEDLESEE